MSSLLGPFNNPAEAAAVAKLVRDLYAAPSPHLFRRRLLAGALDGVELGEWDRCVLGFLADQDDETVVAIAGWITRAAVAAQEEAGEGPAGPPSPR
jgi:hypothetical protein